MTNQFNKGDEVEWDTDEGVITGTILDLFDKTATKNVHLKESSYLIGCPQIEFPFTVPYTSKSIRPATKKETNGTQTCCSAS